MLSRRAVIGGLAGALALSDPRAAWAEGPAASLRPPPRPTRAPGGDLVAPVEPLLAEAKLGGEVAWVVADARTGLILEARAADTAMPPASTLKAVTAMFALTGLGPSHRFVTRLMAAGPVAGGRIAGDLIVAGGGDPVLSTDDLGDLAAAVRAAGVRDIGARVAAWDGALPYLREVDPDQPDHFGYNPSVAGINLNFNRVNFWWKREGADFRLGMDARGERFVPEVSVVGATLADRALPVFAYDGEGPREMWSVARSALNDDGSRWLPVRRPAAYVGDVLATLLRAQGIASGGGAAADRAPPAGGTVIAERQSAALPDLLRDMLRFSTNLTAEAIGMAAGARTGARDHAAAAAAMTDWFRRETRAARAVFVDHSGLGAGSRITAGEMVRGLVTLGPKAGLKGLMRDVTAKEVGGKGALPVRVVAKTGTLNFVSSLAGYITGAGGTELAFAIFTADLARRDGVAEADREDPPGAAAWVKRSKRLQGQLIERWARLYAA